MGAQPSSPETTQDGVEVIELSDDGFEAGFYTEHHDEQLAVAAALRLLGRRLSFPLYV